MSPIPSHYPSPPLDAVSTQAQLTLDLSALAGNWQTLAAHVAPAECAAVIKADAYGIGLEQAALALHKVGCTSFFVAHISEGARARLALAQDPSVTIYVLNGLLLQDNVVETLLDYDLTPVLGSLEDVARWQLEGRGAPAALQVDTGMNRLGLNGADLVPVQQDVAANRLGFPIALLISHFVMSEVADDPHNAAQIKAFEAARARLPGVRSSLANSSGIFLDAKPHYGLVRPGYALYGGNPTPQAPNPMLPVVHLSAPILQIRQVAVGETAGYNATWTAKRPSTLAVIGVGYGDGLPRNASGMDGVEGDAGGIAVLAGVRCPYAGRVSMDLTILDVTDVPEAEVYEGAWIELLGPTITVDELGARSGTIGYEILTNLGRRFARVYVE